MEWAILGTVAVEQPQLVQQLAEEDVEELQQRTQRLYEVTQRRQE